MSGNRSHVSSANAYISGVLSGAIPACKWVRLACQRQVDDLARADFPYRIDGAAAEKVCRFVECLPHVKGKWAGTDMRLEPWQQFILTTVFGWVRRTDGMRRFREMYCEVSRKNGKALKLDTPIPTPTGWTDIGSINIGDNVFGFDGKPYVVTNVSEIFYNHQCYRLTFSNGEQIIADADHLWKTTARVNKPGESKTRNIRRFREPHLIKRMVRGRIEYWYAQLYRKQKYIGRVKEMSESEAQIIFDDLAKIDLEMKPYNEDTMNRIRTTKEIANSITYSKRSDLNHSIVMPNALELPDIKLSIEPYFLGAWLGDGTSASCQFTSGDKDVDHFEKEFISAGYIVTRRKDKTAWRLTVRTKDNGLFDDNISVLKNHPNNLQKILRNNNLLGNKHIPSIYLRASYSQRLSLLQGMMDTDGTINKSGLCLNYSTTSKRLSCDIEELLSSFGIKHSTREDSLVCNGKPVDGIGYDIQFFCFRDIIPVFRLKRKLDRMRISKQNKISPRSKTIQIVNVERVLSIPTKCIMVDSPDGLFLIGKTMIPTHNSILAACIGLYMLTEDREPGSEVYSGAGTEKQAMEVFRPARLMAMKAGGFKDHYGIEVGAMNLAVISTASKFEPIIGNPGDGASPHCAIVDEFHEHRTPNLYDTMITGMGSRTQPLVVIITTAGVDLAGPCYDKRGQVTNILERKDGFENEEVFGVIYTLDDEPYTIEGKSFPADDWTDFTCWGKANPNAGVSILDDYLPTRHREAMQRASRQNVIRCKHLNQWMNADVAWMNMVAWRKCADPGMRLNDFKGRRCYMALDLASKTDLSVLVILFPDEDENGRKTCAVFVNHYLPEDATEGADKSHYAGWAKEGWLTLTPGNVTDYSYIADDMRDMKSRFEIIEVPYDPFQATYLATQLLDEGFPMVEYGATVKNFSQPMKELEALVLSGALRHDGNPVLTWEMSNVVAHTDRKDNIFPNKERAENKIDGPVAVIMALAREMVHREERSVYEDRGILTI